MSSKKVPRATLLSIAFLSCTFLGYVYTTPTSQKTQIEDKVWMRFEKTQLLAVHIEKPNGEKIQLTNKSDYWSVQSDSLREAKRASKTMINRIKHQLHDLDFREDFVPSSSKSMEEYGLGSKATRVKLMLRGSQEQSLLVGDLNPSKVSYYVQHADGVDQKVYTVKKSSMDMFLQPVDAFRESRMINIDMRSLTSLSYQSEDRQIQLRKGEGKDWLVQNAQMQLVLANRDIVMRMIGRLSALKASSFVDVSTRELEQYELSNPRLKWSLQNEIGQKIELLVGKNYNQDLVYYWIEGDTTVYVAKGQLLKDFSFDVSKIVERRIFQRKMDVIDQLVLLRSGKEHALVLQGGDWYWKDGSLVSGITPQRFFEEIRDSQCEISNETFERTTSPISTIQAYISNKLEFTIDVFEHGHQKLIILTNDIPCFLHHSQLDRIMEDVERESNIHHNK
jgi:hypothetical protein